MDELHDALELAFQGEAKQDLGLDYINVDADGVLAVVEALESAKDRAAQFQAVDLGGNHLRAGDLVPFFDNGIPLLLKLKDLDLRDNRIGEEGWEHLEGILVRHCPRIERIDISENYIKDEGARIAATYLTKAKHLQFFSLGTNQLSPNAMVPLEVGVRLTTSLKVLSLAYNHIGDDGVATLCKGLKRNESIQKLNLSDNGIGDAGAAVLGDLLSSRSKLPLVHLDISVNQIGPTGCAAIVKALHSKNAQLRHLDIACNPIGEEGRQKLCSSIGGAHSLVSLDLTSLGLTDSEGKMLSDQVRSPTCRIKKLDWFNNPELQPETEQDIYEAVQGNAKKSNTPRLMPSTMSAKVKILLAIVSVGALGTAIYLTSRFIKKRKQ